MRKLCILLFGLALFGATEAWALDVRLAYLPLSPESDRVAWSEKGNARSGVVIPSVFGDGFADDVTVRRHVGTPQFQVLGCGGGALSRTVDVRLQRADFDHTRVLDQVLRRAVIEVWRSCPIPYDNVFSNRTHDLDIGGLRIFLPDGSLVFEATSLEGDNKGQHSAPGLRTYDRKYNWRSWTNYPALERARAAEAAAAIERERVERLRSERASNTFWGWVRLIVFGALALWLWLKRETLLYWYYSLTPHPAGAMVDHAITTGQELDGKAFAQAVRSISGANEIEKTVRADQAYALAARWREREAALDAEEARLVDDARRQAAQDNALLQAQKDLLDAAIAHEQALARVDALREKEESK